MPTRLTTGLFTSCLLVVACAVGADDLQDSYGAPSCKKPAFITNLRKADDSSDFTEKFNAYQECIKTYTDNQSKLANLHIEAANKAVADTNAYINEINEKQKNAK